MWSRWQGLLHSQPVLGGVFAVLSLTLQGCNLEIPKHSVGNWRAKPSFISQYQFIPPGADATKAALNSCQSPEVPSTMKCSGRGKCVDWFETVDPSAPAASTTPVSFCQCDVNWADPECTTQRKSQLTAFMLSLFFGIFGADQFYLGFWWPQGILKLFTLGGAGIWWIFDVVRVGAAPVLTAGSFSVAADLSHWAFVLIVITFMGLLGFGLSILSISQARVTKAREILLLQAESAYMANAMPTSAVNSMQGGSAPPYRSAAPMYASNPGIRTAMTGSTSFRGYAGYGTTLR